MMELYSLERGDEEEEYNLKLIILLIDVGKLCNWIFCAERMGRLLLLDVEIINLTPMRTIHAKILFSHKKYFF